MRNFSVTCDGMKLSTPSTSTGSRMLGANAGSFISVVARLSNDGDDVIGVLVVGDTQVDHVVREVLRLVGERSDVTVGDRVDGALDVAQDDGPQD